MRQQTEEARDLDERVLAIVNAAGDAGLYRAQIVEQAKATTTEVARALGNLWLTRRVHKVGSIYMPKSAADAPPTRAPAARPRPEKCMRLVDKEPEPPFAAENDCQDPAPDSTGPQPSVVELTIEEGSLPYQYLEAILARGAHGGTVQDVMERLVWEGICRKVDEGWIDRIEDAEQ